VPACFFNRHGRPGAGIRFVRRPRWRGVDAQLPAVGQRATRDPDLAANPALRSMDHYANAADPFARPHLDCVFDLNAVALDSLDPQSVIKTR
jgi:hypothetical protein